jgi:hypothetical protein
METAMKNAVATAAILGVIALKRSFKSSLARRSGRDFAGMELADESRAALQRRPLGRSAGITPVVISRPDQGPSSMGLASLGLSSLIEAR